MVQFHVFLWLSNIPLYVCSTSSINSSVGGDLGCFHVLAIVNGTDEPLCKADVETYLQNKHMDTKVGKEGALNWEVGIDIYTKTHKTDN